MPEKQIRKYGWDGWPDLNAGAQRIELTYHGNGVVKYKDDERNIINDVVEQIDLSETGFMRWLGGDEFDFLWNNSKQINYRPYRTSHSGPAWNVFSGLPKVTLVDFDKGYYGSFVDDDGINGASPQTYIKVDLIESGTALSIELYGLE